MSAVLLLVFVCAAYGGMTEVTVEVAQKQVSLTERDGFVLVRLGPGNNGLLTTQTTEPGKPLLPLLSGNVVLPPGSDVEQISAVPLQRVEIARGVRIYPVQPSRPLSCTDDVPFLEPDPAVYADERPYPTEALAVVPAGSKAGFRLAGFLYCPFEYYPLSGRLVLVTQAEVRVAYREDAVAVAVVTPGQRDLAAADVARLVVNPEDVARLAPPAVEKDARETDVVMFTNAALAPSLAGIRSWLARKGYFAEIVQVDTISQPGRDVPEKMRNLLKQKFADEGLKYVILAGDYDKCPLRYGYLPYSPYNVPADMYFGDLDGDWDANGNSRFGEMVVDSVDLFHDVYVGRLPLDSAGNAANFLRKDTTYETCPDTAYLNNLILPSEWMWQYLDYSGRIVNSNIARILSGQSSWEIDSGMNLGSSRVVSGLNAGRQLFHFAGHGSATAFGSTFSTSNIASLTNAAKPCIVSSIACDCGRFDQTTDCLAERLLNAANGGAVSTMLNARYGWGWPPCQGPNENLDCAFFRNYLAGMNQGRAHGLAKDFLRNEALSQMTTRWAVFTNTLQGDPTMMMWRTLPRGLTVEHPDTIRAMPQTVSVTVGCADGPVDGARVAITHRGELVARAVTNSSGVAYLPVAGVEDTWTLAIAVTAQDARIYQSIIRTSAPARGSLVTYRGHRVDDLNGRLDPGEDTDVYVVVENRGDTAAVSAQGALVSLSPYVVVLDSLSAYGTIAAGDTAVGDAYRVRVARDCPHGHVAQLTLTTRAGSGAWRSNLPATVGLPNAVAGLWATLDTGDYCLAVCANGGIGTTSYRGEGFGFIYPKSKQASTSSLTHGSFMVGTDTNWVCDNFYGAPNWQLCPQDFAMEESLRIVCPPELGAKEFIAAFTDAHHPQPRNVRIVHRSYGSAIPNHKDFVILEYRVFNEDTLALENLYTAVACDFRTRHCSRGDSFDYAGTDSLRNLAFVKSAASGETLALGIRHIYPADVTGFANCIQHSIHVVDGFDKQEKMRFMDGTLRQTVGATPTNWHAMSSAGPYTIPPGDSQIVAFALCAGRTLTQLLAVSDTAAAWYLPPVGIADRCEDRGMTFHLVPNPARAGRVLLRCSRSLTGPVSVTVFDVAGRAALHSGYSAERRTSSVMFDLRGLPGGVYLVRLEADGYSARQKLVVQR